jgi:hypothetical protein
MLKLAQNPLLKPPTPTAGAETHLPNAHVLRRASGKRQTIHALNVSNAARELDRLPAVDESIHVVMRGNFHGWDVVPAVLRLATPATIATLIVATLGFNRQNAAELLDLIDAARIGRVAFLCSVYFQRSCPAEFGILAAGLQQRGQRITAARSHAKVIGFDLSDGRKIVVESSANLRSCRNIEQFCMTQSADLYHFHARWIGEVIDAGEVK